MRVTVMSVFLWVLFLAAQIDARPQELGNCPKQNKKNTYKIKEKLKMIKKKEKNHISIFHT